MNYLQIIKNVLNNGVAKQATRLDNNGNVLPVENGTIGTFCEVFRHDMSHGFPLTTLRKMPWKSVRVELEGFIKGITDKTWYQERGCKFWDEWANPVKVAREYHYQLRSCLDIGETPLTLKEVQEQETDLGPIYGYQWRAFGETYPCSSENGINNGFDQLKSIVEKLKTNPYDRRMVCSAWNPNQMHMAALPACHVLHQVVVYGNKLNLIWFQRSCDLTHGVPANIASYALLLLLYCEESGLEAGELVGILSDCHIYENTIDSAKKLIEREEKELPIVKIKRKENENFSIFNWSFNDVETIGYDPHPPIDMGAVTV